MLENTQTEMALSCLEIAPSESMTVKIVNTNAELERANAVIASAVNTWKLPKRLKRLSLVPLQYDKFDLNDFEMLLGNQGRRAVAVASWEVGHSYCGPSQSRCALLHGLYVQPQYQARGVGRFMWQTVAARARDHSFEGIMVKAQRVSRDYFVKQGFVRHVDAELDYPYLYWKAIEECV